jgi:hypothetical protein
VKALHLTGNAVRKNSDYLEQMIWKSSKHHTELMFLFAGLISEEVVYVVIVKMEQIDILPKTERRKVTKWCSRVQ